jgi:hypothetical protein
MRHVLAFDVVDVFSTFLPRDALRVIILGNRVIPYLTALSCSFTPFVLLFVKGAQPCAPTGSLLGEEF